AHFSVLHLPPLFRDLSKLPPLIYFFPPPQGVVVQSIKKHDPNYQADGFISMCLVYVAFAIANWLAPAVVQYLGDRVSIVVSGLTYMYEYMQTLCLCDRLPLDL